MTAKLGQEPAFPELTMYGAKVPGMNKRFFAACVAMQGILSNVSYTQALSSNIWKPAQGEIAEFAFELADELLKQENDDTNS